MKWLTNLQFTVETGTFILHGTYTNPGAHPASYLVGTRVYVRLSTPSMEL